MLAATKCKVKMSATESRHAARALRCCCWTPALWSPDSTQSYFPYKLYRYYNYHSNYNYYYYYYYYYYHYHHYYYYYHCYHYYFLFCALAHLIPAFVLANGASHNT